MDNNDYYYEFVDASIAQINEWKKQNDNEEITLIIADNGWTDLNKKEFEKAATYLGVNLFVAENKEDIINYINSKDTDYSENQISNNRKNDLVSAISVFSHGLARDNGVVSLGYDYDEGVPELNLGTEDIDAFLTDAFSDNIISNFYSCNTGTAMEKSFAQLWANHVGSLTIAFSGKSDYAKVSDNSLLGKINRKLIELIYGVSMFGGKTSFPVAGSNAYQVEFKPQCSTD